MLFAVHCGGVPIGTVDLAVGSLCAGRLVRSGGYENIASRVRAASAALFAFGVYGPRVSAMPDENRSRARAALHSAAALRLELVPFTGHSIPATFVNLVEAPLDRQVVVIARFRDEPAGSPAVAGKAPVAPGASRLQHEASGSNP